MVFKLYFVNVFWLTCSTLLLLQVTHGCESDLPQLSMEPQHMKSFLECATDDNRDVYWEIDFTAG